MTKAELISEVARKTGLPRKDVGLVINAVLEALKEAFFRKERVELRGFGVFMTKTRKPRVGRNPRTKRSGYRQGRLSSLSPQRSSKRTCNPI